MRICRATIEASNTRRSSHVRRLAKVFDEQCTLTRGNCLTRLYCRYINDLLSGTFYTHMTGLERRRIMERTARGRPDAKAKGVIWAKSRSSRFTSSGKREPALLVKLAAASLATDLSRHAGCIYRRRTAGSARSRSPQSRTRVFKARSRPGRGQHDALDALVVGISELLQDRPD